MRLYNFLQSHLMLANTYAGSRAAAGSRLRPLFLLRDVVPMVLLIPVVHDASGSSCVITSHWFQSALSCALHLHNAELILPVQADQNGRQIILQHTYRPSLEACLD